MTSDLGGAPKVCMINEKFAKKYFWRDVCRGIVWARATIRTKLDTEVVGVFADMRYEGFKDEIADRAGAAV